MKYSEEVASALIIHSGCSAVDSTGLDTRDALQIDYALFCNDCWNRGVDPDDELGKFWAIEASIDDDLDEDIVDI
ncbi:MAG: hypothetical protein U9N61_04360 [Euryarchaeota archaeon]|nr:hypothetical protein [Euryarchaeota archaeon]